MCLPILYNLLSSSIIGNRNKFIGGLSDLQNHIPASKTCRLRNLWYNKISFVPNNAMDDTRIC